MFLESIEHFSAYQKELEDFRPENKGLIEIASLLSKALNQIYSHAEEYDQTTSLTSRANGEQFIRGIRSKIVTEESIKRLFYTSARFIRESTLRRQNFNPVEQEILSYFYRPEGRVDLEYAAQSDFVQFHIPHMLLERVGASVSQLEARVTGWSEQAYKDTDELEKKILAHKAELKKIETDFNFVNLSKAFKKLIEEKNTQKNWVLAAAVILGLVAVIVPIVYLINGDKYILNGSDAWGPASVAKIVGAAAVEIIFLYYFRIVLRLYLVIRSQITNLSLRYSLCAFIEGYLDFAKNKGAASLSGFESMIFSDLPQDDPSLPATVDWLDQVAKVVSVVKK